MFQRVGRIIRVGQPAKRCRLGDELGDAARVRMAQGMGIEPAFLPDEPGKEIAIQPVAIGEGGDGVAGVKDEMRVPDAVHLSPFAGGT